MAENSIAAWLPPLPARGGQWRDRNHFWKGGRTIASNGYVLVKVPPGHHLADVRGYAYEHRLVAEEKIQRRLQPDEQVHHINGVRTDNDPANIEVVASRHHHAVKHRVRGFGNRLPGEFNELIACACGCGVHFPKFDNSGRPRRFISGHNKPRRNGNGQFIGG